MEKVYRVMVIGCGHMGEAHLRDIYYRDRIHLAAVIDKDPGRAELAAKKFGADRFGTDYRDFLDSGKIDIAVIATYAASHLRILRDCLGAGIHVLCEKPVASTLSDAEEFFRTARGAGSKVLVGHILRHNETYQKAAKLIREGAIGSPIVMRMVQNHHTMDWARYKRLLADCPPIVDCGVHYFDVMQWFTGEKIVKVSGVKASVDSDVPAGSYNYGIVTAALSGGSVGYYEAGWGNTVASGNLKEFIGPRGRLSIIPAYQRQSHREEGDLIEFYSYPQKEYHEINLRTPRKPTYRQLLNLIGAVEGTGELNPTLEEAWSSCRAAFAADRALRTGAAVSLSENADSARAAAFPKGCARDFSAV